MPEGGALVVRAREEQVADSRRLPAGSYIRIDVVDSGCGMAETVLSRAIEPFFTTKGIGEGTGLGLSMVHGLAAQSGGDFALASQLGQGTTASLWLPTSNDAVTSHPDDPQQPETSTANATVLLVDDEPLVRMGTASMLVDAGYSVVEAASAEEALQLVGDGLMFDLLITDFAMPGMNGAQLAAQLRRRWPKLPALMITGFASLGDAEGGGLARLAKPFRQTELIAQVVEVLAHAAA